MPRRAPRNTTGGLLSIGTLAASTGIPADTIRTWERRYGFPRAERKPSGHRVYSVTTVPRLRRVAQAIAQGHRPAQVLSASEEDLNQLLAAGILRGIPDLAPATAASRRPDADVSAESTDLLAAVRTFDAESLKRRFHQEWARLGPLEFLERRASPFLSALGDAWAKGSLEIRHEHFGSGLLGDFLRTTRQPLEERATGPMVALATLTGELHGLGLQMTALVFSLAGWQTLLLGVDTPSEQIVSLAKEASLAGVAISCVQPRANGTSAPLRALRRRLPRHIPLLVGGAAAPVSSQEPGIILLPDLKALELWLRAADRVRAAHQ